VSRTAKTRAKPQVTTRRRPVLVLVVYALGILGAAVMLLSVLFSAGGYFGSDDTVVSVSPIALVVWGVLIVLAVATWLWRKRGTRQ
jgi:membrane protein YdbS with pleckstrin-like domain